MFGMGSFGPKGFLRIVPVFEGRELDYAYEADPGLLLIKTEKGTVRLALDGAKVLRVVGSGLGLRFDGRIAFGENVYQKEHGIEFLKGGGIYLLRALKGEMVLDSHWDLKALHATDPIIDIKPDGNAEFELAIYDTDIALELAPLAADIEAAAEESRRDYEAFRAGLLKFSGKFADFGALAAYACWLGLNEGGLAGANKMNDLRCHSLQVPALTLPLADPARVFDVLSAQLDAAAPSGLVPVWFTGSSRLTEAVPPIYAYSVSRALADGGLEKLSKEKLSALYDKMSRTIGWWLKKRTDAEGLSFYAFRHESGWLKYASFACGTPAATAELAAFLFLGCDSLSSMAAALDRADEAAEWAAKAKKQLANLTERLWRGNGFVNINTATGASCPAGDIQSLYPLLIGGLLPDNIKAALIKKASALDYGSAAVIPAALIILGLFSADKEAAEKAAAKLLESCAAGGANDERGKGLAAGTFFNHAACAALLAVCARMSE
jgi:hypothetical protein